MTKKLENFVQHNRDAFDSDVPPLHVWGLIEKNTKAPSRKTIFLFTVKRLAKAIIRSRKHYHSLM